MGVINKVTRVEWAVVAVHEELYIRRLDSAIPRVHVGSPPYVLHDFDKD